MIRLSDLLLESDPIFFFKKIFEYVVSKMQMLHAVTKSCMLFNELYLILFLFVS